MAGLETAFRDLVARLDELGARFAVVGGLAVSARTEPRFTRDADVCVAVADDLEAEALVRELRTADYRVTALVEQEATARIATVRMEAGARDVDGVVVDLLFASSGVEPEIVESAEVLDVFEGVPAPVASIASLIALKTLARDDVERPQDRVDLVALLRTATASDVAEADRLLDLITQRGYARGKDLAAEMEALRAELDR